MAWQIGVDVGGTFTDLLALDPERGVFRVAKVPSTPETSRSASSPACRARNRSLRVARCPRHTVATNAVLERKGRAVG